MTGRDGSAHLRTTQKLRVFQLRAGVRQPGDLATFYPPAGERRPDLWWEAMVPALSSTKLTLVLGRRFEVGTLLAVDIRNALQNAGLTLLARVGRVTASDTGGWVIHGDLLHPLAEDELTELARHGG
jgi:hypothetical protein